LNTYFNNSLIFTSAETNLVDAPLMLELFEKTMDILATLTGYTETVISIDILGRLEI